MADSYVVRADLATFGDIWNYEHPELMPFDCYKFFTWSCLPLCGYPPPPPSTPIVVLVVLTTL